MKDKQNRIDLFLQMIDYLKHEYKIPTTVSARRIGMDTFKIQNLRRGGSSVTDEDLQTLLNNFPELSHFAALIEPTGSDLPDPPQVVKEPQITYQRIPDTIASKLQRIESALQDILRYQEERTKEDQKTIQKLIDYITSTRPA